MKAEKMKKNIIDSIDLSESFIYLKEKSYINHVVNYFLSTSFYLQMDQLLNKMLKLLVSRTY